MFSFLQNKKHFDLSSVLLFVTKYQLLYEIKFISLCYFAVRKQIIFFASNLVQVHVALISTFHQASFCLRFARNFVFILLAIILLGQETVQIRLI